MDSELGVAPADTIPLVHEDPADDASAAPSLPPLNEDLAQDDSSRLLRPRLVAAKRMKQDRKIVSRSSWSPSVSCPGMTSDQGNQPSSSSNLLEEAAASHCAAPSNANTPPVIVSAQGDGAPAASPEAARFDPPSRVGSFSHDVKDAPAALSSCIETSPEPSKRHESPEDHPQLPRRGPPEPTLSVAERIRAIERAAASAASTSAAQAKPASIALQKPSEQTESEVNTSQVSSSSGEPVLGMDKDLGASADSCEAAASSGSCLAKEFPLAENALDSFMAFAMSCMGGRTPQKTGTKMGLMGGVRLEDMRGILEHLEDHATRQVAEARSAGEQPKGPVLNALMDGADFHATFLAACGEASAEQVWAHLPRDRGGHIDLLKAFGIGGGSSGSGSEPRLDFTSDYIENSADLPCANEDLRHEAERQLLEGEAAGLRWDGVVAALNVFRSSLRNSESSLVAGKFSVALLVAIARRCGSPRPALAKCAMRAITELAEAKLSASIWLEACVLRDLLSSLLRATKLAAKEADKAMNALVQLLADGDCADSAVLELCAVIGEAVHPKPQPPVVAAGLKALTKLAPGIVPESDAGHAAKSVSDKVLATRALGAAFTAARGIARILASRELSSAATPSRQRAPS